MRDPNNPPQRIGIAFHPQIAEAAGEAAEIERFLQQHGVKAAFCARLDDKELLRQRLQTGEIEALIALGGDGSMLRASHLAAPYGLPILGINVGRFGFLTEVGRQQWRNVIPLLLEGKYRLEDRMMLRAGHWRGDQLLGEWEVVNEAVVCRGKFVRPIQLKASVDGYLLTRYVADGLLAATPTGSTAYALAVGGPIMPPELRNIMIIAVAPHLSIDRAIILPEGACVTITVHSGLEVVLSVDGHPPVSLADGDDVRVGASSYTTTFIRFQDPGYFYRNLTMHMEQNPSTGGD